MIMVSVLPALSVSHPMTGDRANMPAMCSEMVKPMMTRTSAGGAWPACVQPWPSARCCRCSGRHGHHAHHARAWAPTTAARASSAGRRTADGPQSAVSRPPAAAARAGSGAGCSGSRAEAASPVRAGRVRVAPAPFPGREFRAPAAAGPAGGRRTAAAMASRSPALQRSRTARQRAAVPGPAPQRRRAGSGWGRRRRPRSPPRRRRPAPGRGVRRRQGRRRRNVPAGWRRCPGRCPPPPAPAGRKLR